MCFVACWEEGTEKGELLLANLEHEPGAWLARQFVYADGVQAIRCS